METMASVKLTANTEAVEETEVLEADGVEVLVATFGVAIADAEAVDSAEVVRGEDSEVNVEVVASAVEEDAAVSNLLPSLTRPYLIGV
jgi:hypothetical protein